MKTVRGDKVEKADEKMIMENETRRCNRAVKQKEVERSSKERSGKEKKNERMRIRLTQNGKETE